MSKKSTTIAVLVVLVVLLFSQDSNAANVPAKLEYWDLYAAKDTACYLAQYQNGTYIVRFNNPLKPFKANEFISNSLIGETTYVNANGVKTKFLIVEIETGFDDVIITAAVLETDINRVVK